MATTARHRLARMERGARGQRRCRCGGGACFEREARAHWAVRAPAPPAVSPRARWPWCPTARAGIRNFIDRTEGPVHAGRAGRQLPTWAPISNHPNHSKHHHHVGPLPASPNHPNHHHHFPPDLRPRPEPPGPPPDPPGGRVRILLGANWARPPTPTDSPIPPRPAPSHHSPPAPRTRFRAGRQADARRPPPAANPYRHYPRTRHRHPPRQPPPLRIHTHTHTPLHTR